jgi:predicted secreted protein
MSTFIKGDVVILDVWDGVSAYEPVACLTSNSISETTNLIESQTKCDPGFIEKTVGSYSYEITAEGQCIDTTSSGAALTKVSHDKLRGLQGTSQDWRWSTGITDTPYLYGSAIISSLEVSADSGDSLGTFSVTFSGEGAIVTVDPN